MSFGILGDISDVATFAMGLESAKSLDCEGCMDAAVGANARGSLGFGCLMVRSISLKYTGMKQLLSDARNSRSSTCFEGRTMPKPKSKQLVVCIRNDGYPVSLEKRKIYVALRDPASEKHGLLRIIDESGDDYLYPKTFFRSIALPQSVKRAVLAAA